MFTLSITFILGFGAGVITAATAMFFALSVYESRGNDNESSQA